jgi:hypothetical protein
MSKKKDKERAKQQRRWEAENKSIGEFRAAAPEMKRRLRGWGCDLPFYDFLDSYTEKFEQIAKAALKAHPSLRDVHEVDDPIFRSKNWAKLGYGNWQQVQVHFDDKYENDYGGVVTDENLCGCASIFHDEKGGLRTGIMIRRTVKNWMEHREYKYITKIVALLHELGHVHDIENSINFKINGDKAEVDIIEAEVFANVFALDRLAEQHLRMCYRTFLDAVRRHSKKAGYIGEVCQEVLERHAERDLVDWHDVRDRHASSEADLGTLGDVGHKAIFGK